MIAIYARQSVERPDSISIAMQVEHCRRICPAEAEVRVFTDRGFTGTNTHRPAFREMLEAVEQGEVFARGSAVCGAHPARPNKAPAPAKALPAKNPLRLTSPLLSISVPSFSP